jgi:hypothetical protein
MASEVIHPDDIDVRLTGILNAKSLRYSSYKSV